MEKKHEQIYNNLSIYFSQICENKFAQNLQDFPQLLELNLPQIIQRTVKLVYVVTCTYSGLFVFLCRTEE